MKPFACCDQLLEFVAMVPVKLVHCPRRDGRLRQQLHSVGLVAMSFFFQPGSESVTNARELCQWQREQSVNFVFELIFHLLYWATD